MRSTPPCRVVEEIAHELHAPLQLHLDRPRLDVEGHQLQVAAVCLDRGAHEVDEGAQCPGSLDAFVIGELVHLSIVPCAAALIGRAGPHTTTSLVRRGSSQLP